MTFRTEGKWGPRLQHLPVRRADLVPCLWIQVLQLLAGLGGTSRIPGEEGPSFSLCECPVVSASSAGPSLGQKL